jgi:hypothetical protein
MKYIVELYQEIADSEIENQPRVSRITAQPAARNRNTILHNVTDRNNPMQSSIIKLLTELEGNDSYSDTAHLINEN